jgi:aspartokinase-like uncharacterized kinase
LSEIHVIKLGGSLLDLGDLLPRVRAFLDADGGPCPLIVVGGGGAADLVRAWDNMHRLGDERSHWLAIRAMQFNAHLVLTLLKNTRIVRNAREADAAWRAGQVAMLDPLAWLKRDEQDGVAIPHRWSFTSDSIAAHVARRLGASRLTLLKSTLPAQDCGMDCAAGVGVVDDDFPLVAAGLPHVELVNLRADPVAFCRLS